MTLRVRSWLRVRTCLGAAFHIGLAATGADAQTFEITTATSTPYNPATLTTSAGTIHVTTTGSIITQHAGNHAIQPYVIGGLTGRWNVRVDGTVRSTAPVPTELYGIWLRNGGDVTVGSSGTVQGSYTGVMVDAGFSSVVNDGTIIGTRASISLQGGGTVTNAGTLVGGVVGGSFGLPSTFVNTESGMVTASGPSSGSGPFGFLLNAGGNLVNAGTVSFNNVGQGLWAHASTTFLNTGTYSVLGDAAYVPQIYAALFQTGDVVASNAGAITGREVGLFAYQNSSVSLSNSGSITTQKLDAIYVRYGSGSIDVSQSAGQIRAGRNGIAIRESGASAVDISGGSVEAGTNNSMGVGVLFDSNSGLSTLKVSNATIAAPATAIQAIGTNLSASLLDGATIEGNIVFDIADDSLGVSTGATVNGAIDGGGGADRLELTGAGSATLATHVSNFETLAVRGGHWVLDGDYSFSGGMNVDGSSVAVNGLLDAAVTVGDGARLQGSGSVGSTTVADGGTIAPGNSIGTLNVAGALTFNAGSTYEVEVDPTDADSDLIHATGTAMLNDASVTHVGMDGSYQPFSVYTILTADGGIDGTFGNVTSAYAFLTPTLDYDANNVYLELERNDTDFADKAATRNQKATAEGTEALGQGNALYNAVASLPDNDALIRDAFDSLSGEIHASVKTVLIEDSHFVRDAVGARLDAAFSGTPAQAMPLMSFGQDGARSAAADNNAPGAWGRAFGAWGETEGDGNAARLDRSTGGFLTGFDGALTRDLRLGLLAGYSHSSFHADERASSGSSDNYHLGLYGGGRWDAFRLDGGLAYTWHDIETSRSVNFPGFGDSLSADYDAGTFQVFGEAGYRVKTGVASFEPFVGLAHVNSDTDGIAEHGHAAALSANGGTTEATFSTLGLKVEADFAFGTMTAKAHGAVSWRHAFGDTVPLSTNVFTGGAAFTVAGTPIAEDAAIIEAGLDLAVTDSASLGLSYAGQIASDAEEHGFNARFGIAF